MRGLSRGLLGSSACRLLGLGGPCLVVSVCLGLHVGLCVTRGALCVAVMQGREVREVVVCCVLLSCSVCDVWRARVRARAGPGRCCVAVLCVLFCACAWCGTCGGDSIGKPLENKKRCVILGVAATL
jgi:hypothetical protein